MKQKKIIIYYFFIFKKRKKIIKMSLKQMLIQSHINNELNNNLLFLSKISLFNSFYNMSYFNSNLFLNPKLDNYIYFNPIIYNPFSEFHIFSNYNNDLLNQYANINCEIIDNNKNNNFQNNNNLMGPLTDNSSKIFFTTKTTSNLPKKKCKIKTKRVHGANAKDNILKKIQVHFLSFIVNYTNDVIDSLIKDKNAPHFKPFAYEIKKKINLKYVEDLKMKTIGEVLQFKASSKFKITDINVNKYIYKIICEMCPSLQNFLNKSYMDLFKEYFTNKNKIFEVNGKLIQISEKTKTFNDLIEKYYSSKEKIKIIAINYYFNNSKSYKKPIFKTHVFNK